LQSNKQISDHTEEHRISSAVSVAKWANTLSEPQYLLAVVGLTG